MNTTFQISGQLINIKERSIVPSAVHVVDGIITKIETINDAPEQYLLPGFIHAHIHIESSMLIPSEFARLAVLHGTVATVSDPHEIGNVLGVDGVNFMIENGKQSISNPIVLFHINGRNFHLVSRKLNRLSE